MVTDLEFLCELFLAMCPHNQKCMLIYFPLPFNFLSDSLSVIVSVFPFVFSPLVFSPPFTHTRKNTSTKLHCCASILACVVVKIDLRWSISVHMSASLDYRIVTSCARTLQPYWWCLNSRVNKSLTKSQLHSVSKTARFSHQTIAVLNSRSQMTRVHLQHPNFRTSAMRGEAQPLYQHVINVSLILGSTL